MVRRLGYLALCCMIALGAPAGASPEADAEYIAARFVTDAEFSKTLHDMAVDAHAAALSSALSGRSVKIKDPERFVELIPDSVAVSLADNLRQTAAAHLAQQWEPARLTSVAAYLRQSPDALQIDRSYADETVSNRTRTLEEMQQESVSVLQSDNFKDEAALSSVAIMLFALMVQQTRTIPVDLKAPYVADMLEVNGVFSFPNRIVQTDLIRELRADNP